MPEKNGIDSPFSVELEALQPSQLFICAEKLANLQVEIEKNPKNIEPVPVKNLGPYIMLTDGHTRAFATHIAGARQIQAVWETDELDWEAYHICVDWCIQDGIRSIADLKDRVIPPDVFEEKWYGRCRAMHQALAEKRKRKKS